MICPFFHKLFLFLLSYYNQKIIDIDQIRIRRAYENPSEQDGYCVLVDRFQPCGIKKEYLKYDCWTKGLTPSSDLGKWFHGDVPGHWEEFAAMYRREFETSDRVIDFLVRIHPYKTVTLLYASKEPVHNHARILQVFLEDRLRN